MILEQGMNVKIVLFPDGEDPDSFTRKNRSAEVVEYINKNANNFILFKTNLLLEETAHDPIKKAGLIKEIVSTISLIPDSIQRSVYSKECSSLLDIPEQTLINELNKLLRKKVSKSFAAEGHPELPEISPIDLPKQDDDIELDEAEYQEKDIIRLLLNHGNKEFIIKGKNDENEEVDFSVSVAFYIIKDIQADDFSFKNLIYQQIFEEFIKEIETDNLPNEQFFTHHSDSNIRETAINLLSSPYVLSDNWDKMHRIYVPLEEDIKKLEISVKHSILSFKLKKVEEILANNEKDLKVLSNDNDDDLIILMENQKKWLNVKKIISAALGRIIIK
jgi:DNA primase